MSMCSSGDPANIGCGNCGIIPHSTWDEVPSPVLETLAQRKTIRTIPKGSFLFHQGGACEALYRLLSGVVLLKKGDHDGNSLVVQMVRKGATIGYRAFLRNEAHCVSAYCATDVVVCHIPSRVARWAFEQNHRLEQAFAANLASDLDQTENQILNILGLTVRDRVLVLLAQMAEEFGSRDGDGMRIETPLLRTDMAAMLGIARESMSRCIRAVEEEGLLEFRRESVYAPSWERFEAAIAAITQDMPQARVASRCR
ncbi:MAG: Crp/Fnr family transcriptional regulator [Solirubrobacterales bacterium]